MIVGQFQGGWTGRLILAWAAWAVLGTSFGQASVPTEAARRAELVGELQAVTALPEAIELEGSRAMRQVLVTGEDAEGRRRDVTALADYAVEPADLAVVAGGFLLPRKDGEGKLRIVVGGQSLTLPLVVRKITQRRPASFRNELVPVLNVGGCNQGACHGTPSGKGGFRLSLRGHDPAADYLQLTRDLFARRVDRQNPEASLVYQKAIGRVPHEGGQRFRPDSLPTRFLLDWLADGLPDDPASLPTLRRLEVLPGPRVLRQPGRFQQLAVLAHYSDGSIRDVTRLSNFSSSDLAVADVDAHGLIEFSQAGEIAVLVRFLETLVSVRFTYLAEKPGFRWVDPPQVNFVDRHVFEKLKTLSIPPSELCTDQEFLRRAHLDLCAVLPTPEETRAFLASKDPNKRAKLVESLLQRPEYADFWTLKWSDVLRSTRKTLNEKGVFVLQRWLRDHVAKNTPFDQVVRELLTATGSTHAHPPANYYRVARDPQALAETTAQLFCGVRLACARCHNHPFERWTQDDYFRFAAFFARVKLKRDAIEPGSGKEGRGGAEVVFEDREGEVVQPRSGQPASPTFLGGPVADVPRGGSRREALADWLTSERNPFFARATVNRVWYHLMGRGIVEPVDDFRDSNPPANDALLDALARDFIANGYDIQRLIRTITTSRTYQLSAVTNAFNKDDMRYFSHATVRMLTAEQLLDAICQATDAPEKFEGLPLGTRAVQLPDGESNHVFLKTFGQPSRELPCECEREIDGNLAQALQLINGELINEKIRVETNRIGKLLERKLADREIIVELFLATLCRPPSDDEIRPLLDFVGKRPRRKALEDVLWTLLNTKEFLFRH